MKKGQEREGESFGVFPSIRKPFHLTLLADFIYNIVY